MMRPKLPKLYDVQEIAVANAVEELLKGVPAGLNVLPTGTGKTVCQVAVMDRVAQAGKRVLQIVPSMEIAAGFARLYDISIDRPMLERLGIFTAKRLLNELSRGNIDTTEYDFVQDDESHHFVDETHKAIDLFLGFKPRQGWTATDYRGTPKGTADLHAYWGNNVHRWVTEEQAAARGFTAVPSVEVLPLVDDDVISVTGGEFSTVGIEAATKNRLEELVSWTKKFWVPSTGLWDRPTMLTLTSIYLVEEAMRWFEHFGLPAVPVIGGNSRHSDGRMGHDIRQQDFKDVVERRKLLVQIKVVGEGVDLPLRRLIDAAPTMSPVLWRQRIGRIMRPVKNEPPPEYIVTNHNLMRHGYLLAGVLPPTVFHQARRAWGDDWVPSRRMVGRAVNLQGLGRFVPNEVPLKDGGFYWMFILGTPDGRKHYAALIPPHGGESIYAVREFEIDESDGTRRKRWDKNPKWRRIKKLPDLQGCVSIPAPPLTPNAKRWWDSAAKLRGLDPKAEVNARVFQVLPLLTDIGGKFRSGGTLG